MPYDRLRLWQDFRKKISAMSLDDAVRETEHLWSYAPYQKHYLSIDDIQNWPNPWELLFENYYCNLAIALGIVYTMYLSEHCVDMDIRIYVDTSTKEQYNLVFIEQGKYVLNLEHDTVLNNNDINKQLKLKKIISTKDLGLDKIQ